MLGIVARRHRHDRLGEPAPDVVLAPGPACAEHVERDARDDGGEPAAEVRDGLGVGAGEAQPRLLDRVLGLGHRAEHSVGDRSQVRPVELELLAQQV